MSSEQIAVGRRQQLIAATALLGFALWIAYVSFQVDNPRPYLFPQLISVTLVGLASAMLIRTLRGAKAAGRGITSSQSAAFAPAIALMLLYVTVLAPVLGYYIGAAVTFFGLYTIYDPASHSSLRNWGVRLAVTLAFISIIYIVFALGLHVLTPRGLFF